MQYLFSRVSFIWIGTGYWNREYQASSLFDFGLLFSVGYFRKKIFRIFRIFENAYLTEGFFMEIRNLQKTFMVKKLLKIYCSQTVNFDLSQTRIPKHRNIHSKKHFWKGVVIKLWPSISPKPVFPKTTESE